MLGRIARQIMREAEAPTLVAISLGLPVLQHGIERRLRVRPEGPAQRQRRAPDLHFHQRRFNRDGGFGFGHAQNCAARKAGKIEPVTAFDRVVSR